MCRGGAEVFAELAAVQRYDNIVDLENRCKMNILLLKSALIQPRTSPPKFALFDFILVLFGP